MSALAPGGSRRTSALVALLSVTVVYLVHAHAYRPRVGEAEEIRFRVTEMRAWTDRTSASFPAATARSAPTIEEYRSRMSQLEAFIPAREDLPELLNAISRADGRTGVDVTMLRPEEPQRPEAEAPYVRNGYRVAVAGGYHEIASFLTAIASLDRIMVPADLVLSTDPTVADPRSSTSLDPVPTRLVADFRILTVVPAQETKQ